MTGGTVMQVSSTELYSVMEAITDAQGGVCVVSVEVQSLEGVPGAEQRTAESGQR